MSVELSTIALLKIVSDTTIYVATNGNDTRTFEEAKNASTPLATLQKALDLLRSYHIDSNAIVTVYLAYGAYPVASTICLNHPCQKRINIAGGELLTKTQTSVQSVGGSSGNYSIILNLNNVTDVAVNDYVLIRSSTGGSRPQYNDGCWKVTNVDSANSRITVVNRNITYYPSGAVSSSSVKVVKTILYPNGISANLPIIKVENTNAGSLSNMVIKDEASTSCYGIYLERKSYLSISSDFGFSGLMNCVYLKDSSTATCGYVYIAAIDNYAIRVQYDCKFVGNPIVCGKNTAVIYAEGGTMEIHGTRILSGRLVGYYGATIQMPNSYVGGTNDDPVAAWDGTYINMSNSVVTDSGGNAIKAGNGSFVQATGFSYSGVSAPSPTVNTVGNYNSYIKT